MELDLTRAQERERGLEGLVEILKAQKAMEQSWYGPTLPGSGCRHTGASGGENGAKAVVEVLAACGSVGVWRRSLPQAQLSPVGRRRAIEMLRNWP